MDANRTPGFTPGPWTIQTAYRGRDRQKSDYFIFGRAGLPKEHIAIVLDGRHTLEVSNRGEEASANACLIAAAPELYEALRLVVAMLMLLDMDVPDFGWDDKIRRTVQGVKAALDKAEGKKLAR